MSRLAGSVLVTLLCLTGCDAVRGSADPPDLILLAPDARGDLVLHPGDSLRVAFVATGEGALKYVDLTLATDSESVLDERYLAPHRSTARMEVDTVVVVPRTMPLPGPETPPYRLLLRAFDGFSSSAVRVSFTLRPRAE